MKYIKKFLRRFGYDVVTYRPFLELLPQWGIKTVLDVGANEGQFAKELRSAGYQGAIYSFEPTSKAFERLQHNRRHDAWWQAVNAGLGRTNEQRIVTVAEDSQLTSILEPVRKHIFAGEETIHLMRLDDWLARTRIDVSTTCLKIDVQGYEWEVLAGAGDSLPMFHAMIIELAVSKSYHGQPYAEEITGLLRGKGFDLWTTRRGTWTPHGMREIECDGLFKRRI
jgi:FkbM family methyltransferase